MTLLFNLTAILALAMLVMAALGVGRRLLRATGVEPPGLAAEISLSLGLGLGLLAYSTALLGAFGGLTPGAGYALLGGALLLGLSELPRLARATRAALLASPRGEDGLLPRFLVWLLGAYLVVYFFAALAPPMEGDTLAGYLSVPKAYVEAGRIHPISYKFYDDLPLNVQMLATLSLLVHGDVLAQLLVGFAMGAFALLALNALASQWSPPGVFGLAALTFYMGTEVAYTNASAKIDLGWLFFDLLSIFAFSVWFFGREGGRERWLLLAGILGGASLGAKYPAAYTAMALALAVGWRTLAVDRLGLPDLGRRWLLYGLPIVLLGFPWLLKNYLYVGNPVYPLFNRLFTGVEAEIPLNHVAGPLGFFTIWWDMSVGYIAAGFGKPIGPLILAGLPALLLVRRPDPRIKWLLFYALVAAGFWYLGVQRPRNLLPGIALLALCSAYGTWSLLQERGWLRGVVTVILLVPLSVHLFDYARVNLVGVSRLAYAAGLQDRETFIRQNMSPWYPSYAIVQYVNSSLPPDARIVGLLNGNDYYLEREYLQSVEPEARIVHEARTAPEVLDGLKARRITHVLINDYIIEQHRAGYGGRSEYRASVLEDPAFQIRHLRLLFEDGQQRLYEVSYTQP